MKLAWVFFIFSLSIVLCKNKIYSDEQIIIMLNQYFEDSSDDQLLGNHIFTNVVKIFFRSKFKLTLPTLTSL